MNACMHVIKLNNDFDCLFCLYTVSPKNDTNVAHYNFNEHQPILLIFGRGIAEQISY